MAWSISSTNRSGRVDSSNYTVTATQTAADVAAIEGTINGVAATLDSYLANPVTVTITFNESTTGLGNSSVGVAGESYKSNLSDVETRQTLSPVDIKALASLGQTAPFDREPRQWHDRPQRRGSVAGSPRRELWCSHRHHGV